MPVSWNSELMLNQKYADVLAPGAAFRVVQTSDGGAVYLSIGTDHTFCMTREVQDSVIGWEHADQSSSLSSQYQGQPIQAKSFAVSQNARSLVFDLALVVNVAGSDYLYLSLHNPPESEALGRGLSFIPCPFDGERIADSSGLQIADVFLATMPGQPGAESVPNCFVDVVRRPGDPLRLLDRYYINTVGLDEANPASSRWNRQRLAIDLAAGSISSCPGQRYRDRVPGIYTFGDIAGQKELIYTPQRNVYRPDAAPNSITLALPPGSTGIATSPDGDGYSNLFVAAAAGIYLWTSGNQNEQASPMLIVPADAGIGLLSGIKGLSATTSGGRTQICGLNSQGDLVHTFCSAGGEASSVAWSPPLPLVSNVQSYSFYLDSRSGNTVLFADHADDGLLQLSENPVTSSWSERRILLPPTSYDNFSEYHSFTTHISVSDKNAMSRADVQLDLTAATPVSVYINNKYYVLGPAPLLRVSTGASGTLTVIQETQNLEAAAFTVTVVADDASCAEPPALVRPMKKLLGTLSSIQTGNDLGNVTVETDDGTKRPLVGGDVSDETKDVTAKAIAKLVDINRSLPEDGSTKPPDLSEAPDGGDAVTWGVSLDEGAVRFVEGNEALLLLVSDPQKRKKLANAPHPITLGDIGDIIRAKAGAFLRWLKGAWHKVTKWVVQEISGIKHFLCTIADKVYQVALDCYHAVAGALEFVFTQIKTFFQDLVRWLGFIFNWDDILRTHAVLKNLLVRYSENMVAQFDTAERAIEKVFIGLEDQLNALTGITDDGETIGTHADKARKMPSTDLPQANWGLYHAVHGAEVATVLGQEYPMCARDGDAASNDARALLDVLVKAVENEAAYLKTTMEQLRTQVVDDIASQRPIEAMKKVLGILGDLFFKSTRNIIVALIDVIKTIVAGVVDMLKAPIHIPILSWIYKKMTRGSEFSILDLFCLIGAIAATTTYKLIANRAPYRDNAQTDALISATSWEALRRAMLAPASSFASPARSDAHHGHRQHHHNRHHRHSHEVHHQHGGDKGIGNDRDKYSSDLDGYTIAQSVTNLAGPFGGLFLLRVASYPQTRFIRSGNCVAYILFVSPNYVPLIINAADWMTPLNDFFTILCIGKTLADNFLWNGDEGSENFGPLVEGLLNICWFAPSCGWVAAAREKEGGAMESDVYSFMGAIFGLLYGVGAGMTAEEWGPHCVAIGKGLVKISTVCYCFCSVITGSFLMAGM